MPPCGCCGGGLKFKGGRRGSTPSSAVRARRVKVALKKTHDANGRYKIPRPAEAPKEDTKAGGEE